MIEIVKRHRILILHITLWIAYISYGSYGDLHYFGFKAAVIRTVLRTVCLAIPSYIHYFFILPPWLNSKKSLRYVLSVIVLTAFGTAFNFLFSRWVADEFATTLSQYYTVTSSRVTDVIWNILTFMLFTGMIRFALNRFDLERNEKQAENEKLISELNCLKSQVNPDFLFSTLHNLDLLVKARSAKATEVLIKLSNIMRYMIYEATKDKVALSKEIDYINDYIDLLRARTGSEVQVGFDVEGEVNGVEIAPLILAAFLESALKSFDEIGQRKVTVTVKVNVSNDLIHGHFSLGNPGTNPGSSRYDVENIKKRLELSYPEKHELIIVDNAEGTTIDLNLPAHDTLPHH